MMESIGSLLHVLLATLGLAPPDLSAAALVAVAITALTVVALALQTLVLPRSPVAASARPRRVTRSRRRALAERSRRPGASAPEGARACVASAA